MAPSSAPPSPLGLDHVVVAVADLEAATAAHAALLGRMPSWRGVHPGLGTRNALFRLGDPYVELLAGDGSDGPLGAAVEQSLRGKAERPFALALGTADVAAAVRAFRAVGIAAVEPQAGRGSEATSGVERTWRSAFVDPGAVRGLRLLLIEHTSPPELLPLAAATAEDAACPAAIDHIVVFTEDIEASRALWQDCLGLAAVWRHDFPERRTRNLGLDLGGIVLELIQRTDRAPRGRYDVLWGIAYRVADCALATWRVRSAGIEIDPPRDGLDHGTRVASVRWERTPTLLIERP
jgi:catechol 2,3-dioxygenase-like lactoylglutathione lyase family enzyme